MDGDCDYDFDLLERYTFFWITWISASKNSSFGLESKIFESNNVKHCDFILKIGEVHFM